MRSVFPEVPIATNVRESLEMICVLQCHSTDVGVLWHVVGVALACEKPKRFQIEVGSWLAISQCQHNSVKNGVRVSGLTCFYFDDAVLQGEFFISLDDSHVVVYCSNDTPAKIFTLIVACLILSGYRLGCCFAGKDCCN